MDESRTAAEGACWGRERPPAAYSAEERAEGYGRIATAATRWPRWQRRLASHLRNASERIVAGRNDEYPAPNEPSDAELWDRVVYGPPERCIAQLRRDAEMGFTDFIGWFDVGGLPMTTVERSMRRFAAEVTPALAEAAAAR